MTLDHTIPIGPDARLLSKSGLERVLAHERIHLAQQDLPGRPGNRAALEREADDLAPLALAGWPVHPRIPASPEMALHTERTLGTDAADQQIWVRRVDTNVRDRFRLRGVRTRMTDRGRVMFQDSATFARGFGRRPRDLLIETFAGDPVGVVNRIKNSHDNLPHAVDTAAALAEIERFVDAHIASGFLYWDHYALSWRDYGLTGISGHNYSWLERVGGRPHRANAQCMHWVTRAQAEAAARRRPGLRYEVADGRS